MAAVVAAAAATRLVGLGDRPMHHDESLDAWFSWQVWRGEPYRYDPVYHGPLRFYLTSGIYSVLGVADASARLLAALAGTATVALCGATRRWIGDVGSIAAAALMAISPTMLYFSRFGREDSLMGLLELGLLVAVLSWLTAPRWWHPALVGTLAAMAFATKETMFIVAAVTGSYLLGFLAWDRWRARRAGPAPRAVVLEALRSPGWRGWTAGIAAFALAFAALFSVGFSDLGGIGAGAFDGIDYWLSQQPVNRGSMPPGFYAVLLCAYELPIVVLAVVGGWSVVRRRDPVLGLVAWTAAANLAVYSWASERFPLLLVHPLIPMVLLAGLAVQRWSERPAADRPRWVWAAAAVGAVVLAATAARVVYVQPSDPRELLAAVQSSDQVPAVRDRVLAAAEGRPADDPLRVVVDSSSSGAWPWSWYLRDLDAAYVDLAVDPAAAADADVVLADAANLALLPAEVQAWPQTPYDLRRWWLPEWGDGSPLEWADWWATREVFNPTGATGSVLLERAPGSTE